MQTILIAVVSLISLVILVMLLTRHAKGNILHQQVTDLKNRIDELREKQLESSNRSIENQKEFYAQSQRLLSDVHLRLGSLQESSKQIQEIGRDISSLQNILQAPKLRGGLGEYLLEDLLKQILPEMNFTMQHFFKDGTVVDAVIKLGDGLVPIDSKFPLESFQRFIDTDDKREKSGYKREFLRSVKERIDEIAQKYINPDEGTFDFAMMYIPAENVFYEIIITDNLTNRSFELFNYALERHVIPVSPNSFYSYLMAIVFGLKGFRIEQQAKEIIGELTKVQSSFRNFYADFSVVGRHIKNASSKFDDSMKRADNFNEQITKLTGVKTELVDSDT
ncbi:MAG: DNA recombination protein RmuC [Spirochaetota bacterium]|nr:MAG: DNA recombination protein RmuC [Spirochaetota bacterium]